ncbi:MAG: putative hydrolase of the superfamily [Acidimicrobiaceae bacterium]|nr:putative hydrolase of the superfamily [Acidimicrobiaceae bacterium]
MIEAVIFDWGGTLSVYTDVDMVDMWRMAAKHLASGTDPTREDEICKRLVEVEADAWAGIPVDQRSFTLAQLLAQASEALHLDVAAAVIEEATQGHLDAWTPHIRHDPAAPSVLARLKERGLQVGLLSNTHWPREFHEHFLARDGLVDYIDARLYTSELTYSKPHASAFRATLDALGVADAGNAVMVGDRAYDDVFGAQQAGLRGVLRPHGGVPGYDVEPDAVIGPLPELLDVLDRWG